MYTIQKRLHRGAASTAVVLLLAAISAPLFSLSAFADNSGTDTGNGTTADTGTQATSLPVAVVANPAPASEQSNQPTVAVVSEPAGVSASLSSTDTPPPASSTNAAATPSDTPKATANTAAPAVSTQNTATTNATVATTVSGQATSGNASVHDNTTAGNATSGNASAGATVVNVVNSSTGFGGDNGGFTFYTRDINAGENVQGNILIDPSTMAPMNSTSSTASGVQTTTSMLDIINNITLNAASGNASVHDNNQAGNATSGDASAIANIINVVNSQIGAQQTFLGVINIYGNLTGDIQVPSDFVNGLLHGTTGTSTGSGSATTSSTTTIDNNITTSATTGNATVHDNNQAGNATSGNATTNVTVFNLTGQQVIAKNSLLVFVNVLGKWVGVIVNQPAGTTSGALVGGDASSASTVSNGSTSTSNTHITNNVTASATTGNATVHDNNQAGNATTGNAQTGVNLLNIANSNFSLDGWFGVLFINVLGSWLGNFGINSPIPDPVSTGGSNGGDSSPQVIQAVKVFQFGTATTFEPTTASKPAKTALATAGTSQATPDPEEKTMVQSTGKVLGTSDNRANALVSRIDLIALLAIVAALTLLLMLGSWLIRKVLVRRRPVSA